MQRALLKAIEDRAARTSDKTVKADELAAGVIEELALGNPREWSEIRNSLVLDSVTRSVRAVMRRSLETANSDQGWLPFPEFEHMPKFIEVDNGWLNLLDATLEQYRQSRDRFKAKIAGYNYARQTSAKEKRDKRLLREMAKFDNTFAPYFAGDPAMTFRRAFELHQQYLVKPTTQRHAKGGKAKSAKTKNQ